MFHFVKVFAVLALLLHSDSVYSEIIRIPEDSPNLAAAFAQSVSGDTILLSSGLHRETVNVPQGLRTLASDFLFSGDEGDIVATVLSPLDTVLADTACVLYLAGGCSLSVFGITFDYGKGIRRSNGRREGGAIYASQSFLHVSDCVFSNCFADFGICVWTGSNSELRVRRSQFTRNGRVDGTTFSQGCIRASDGNLHVDSCRFTHNTVTGAPALISIDGISLIENCVIDSNFNPNATLSAIVSDGSELTVRGCVFRDNLQGIIFSGTCIGGDGPSAIVESCVFVRNTGTSTVWLTQNSVLIQDCVFEGNVAIERNPACIVLHLGNNTVERCTFTNNSAPNWVTITANNTTTIRDCYFAENNALDDSGAVLSAASESLIVENCHFANNSPYAFSTDFEWFHGYVDARNCYWGASTGPYQEHLNPSGDGDVILGTDVLFVPWLTEPPLSNEERLAPVVDEFGISKAFPNPFNSTVNIEYALTKEQIVQVEIFDLLGRKVETLMNESQSAGVHSVSWQADSYSSGVYFARLTSSATPTFSQAVKLLLLK